MRLKVRDTVFTMLCIASACGVASGWCRRDPELPVGSRRSIVREFRASDFVFSGRVVELGNRLTFKVDDVWKGRMSDRITFVYNDGFISDLDVSFSDGQSYVVFGGTSLYGFSASSCGNTKRLDEASSALKELDWIRQNPSLADSFLNN